MTSIKLDLMVSVWSRIKSQKRCSHDMNTFFVYCTTIVLTLSISDTYLVWDIIPFNSWRYQEDLLE
jgi:hypothetical protein